MGRKSLETVELDPGSALGRGLSNGAAAGHVLRVTVTVQQPAHSDWGEGRAVSSPTVRVRDPGPETSEAVTARHHMGICAPQLTAGAALWATTPQASGVPS